MKCLAQVSKLTDVDTCCWVVIAVFCCVGALAITGSLDHVDKDLLGWWLCERQVKSGGLNGRPEKLPDVSDSFLVWNLTTWISFSYDLALYSQLQVCYSWWVLSSLIMIDRVHWIDKKKLADFILDCQVIVLHLELTEAYMYRVIFDAVSLNGAG